MKKNLLIISVLLFSLYSCEVQKPLYKWSNYDESSYNYLKRKDKKSTDALIKTYQKIIDSEKGSRGVVPPGVYADYGFILLQNDKKAEGEAMFAKELELYPESKVFIERILEKLKK
jgi:hypothetical protein